MEDSHCAVMSGWQPLLPQALDSRKKSCGIRRFPTVETDDGKNGLFSPPPSSNGVRGAVVGLTMVAAGGGNSHRRPRTAAGRAIATRSATATRRLPVRLPRAACQAMPAANARTADPTWAYRTGFHLVAVPVTASTMLVATARSVAAPTRASHLWAAGGP